MDFAATLKKEKKFLLIIFFLSLLVRGLFFQFYLSKDKNYSTGDSDEYHNVAVSLANGNGFINPDGTHHFLRVPGYSIFLAIIYKFFNFSVKNALWFQVVISCLIPIQIFLLTLVLFPKYILLARLCSIFVSVFHLGFILFSGYLMTESFFVLFFLLFYLFFITQSNFLLSGAFLGIASLIRPVGHFVLIVAILAICFMYVEKLKKTMYLLIGWVLVVFGWLLRNYLLTGLIFFHALPGRHFLYQSALHSLRHANNYTYQKAKDVITKKRADIIATQEKKKGHRLDEVERNIVEEGIAFKIMTQYPLITLKHSIVNVLKTILTPYSEEFYFIQVKNSVLPVDGNADFSNKLICKLKGFLFPNVSPSWLTSIVYLDVLFHILLLLGFAGFCLQSFFDKKLFFLFLKVFPFVALFIALSFGTGFARMRLPVESFLIIFSLSFWLRLWRKLSDQFC